MAADATPRFAALGHRDFLLLWTGQGFSFIGTQIQYAAVAWHLYLLTHSPLSLGLLGLFRIIPILALALGGGVIADAMNRRRLLILTQSVLALCSLGLALLTATGRINASSIYALTLLSGCANAFDSPAMQAIVPSLVPREHLGNALSLDAMIWQLASVIGPGIAGLLLAATHGVPTLAYALDAFSFVFVVIALLSIRHREPPAAGGAVSLGAAIEGLRFIKSQPVIRAMMIVDFLACFFAGATLLLPIFATDVLKVGATGYGVLAAAASLGSVAAALVMAWLPPVRARGKMVLVMVAVYGAAIAGFGASRVFVLSLLLLAISGAADTVSMVIRQTTRQMLTPDALRGRMTAVNMIFFMGGPQLGEVEAGALARVIGAPGSVMVGGLACVVVAALAALILPALRNHRA